MKARYAFFLPLALAVAAIIIVATSGTKRFPSPTHVVAVFLDGYDHADYRQACGVQKPEDQPMIVCEEFYVSNVAQGLFFGRFGGYKVVPHSVKEWRWPVCRDGHNITAKVCPGDPHGTGIRMVELATVEFVYAPQGGKPLTAHLRKTKNGWRIWAIT